MFKPVQLKWNSDKEGIDNQSNDFDERIVTFEARGDLVGINRSFRSAARLMVKFEEKSVKSTEREFAQLSENGYD